MKKVESFRHCEGKGIVVRLLSTIVLDSKWVEVGFDWEKRKKWVVVRYSSDYDKYIAGIEERNQWDTVTYEKLGKDLVLDKTTKNTEKKERHLKAKILFNECRKDYFWTDTWEEAENMYIDWCLKYCGKIKKTKKFLVNHLFNEEEE